MRLVVATEHGPREVVLDARPDATVGDLLAELGSDATSLTVGTRTVPADHALDEAGLHDGIEVSALPTVGGASTGARATVAPSATAHRGPWLAVTGGTAAGLWWPLAAGRLTIGRDPRSDVVVDHPTVSARHAELEVSDTHVEVADAASTNGTWLAGEPVTTATRLEPGRELRLGAVTFELVTQLPDDRPVAASHVTGPWSFNRPPRVATPPAPAPIDLPSPARDVSAPAGFGWASLLTPIVMAVAMVLVFDNPMFALFAIISPLTLLGSWWEQRRRTGREQQHERTRSTEERERFAEAVRSAVAAERRRRLASAPHLAEVARRATAPSTRLWERRPSHDDAFTVGIGSADVPHRPQLVDGSVDAEAQAVLVEHGRLDRTPVTTQLADGAVIGIVGPRAAATALARSIVLQMAVHHGPADVELAGFVAGDRIADWAWASWLPHARDPRDRDRDTLITDRSRAEALADAWLAEPRETGPTRLVVCDADGITEGRRAPVRAVLNGEAGPVAGVVVADAVDRLPAACRAIVVVDADGAAELREPLVGRTTGDVLAWGIEPAVAREVARALARFEDAELSDATTSLPRGVTLPVLLDDGWADADATLARWRDQPSDPGLRVPIGVGPDGPLWLDLVADGPHALVGGTTGSGKSELLRSLVVGLATQVGPSHLNVVLIDYKGGSAFDVCADLPHTVGVVTDLDEHLGARALRCLEAELHHRERTLRDAGAADLPSYLELPIARTAPLPRLLVVIDEFATVAAELPDFLEALVGIAQRGRSLGVHLVLATQRPSGVVNDNIRANTNLRIALRVQDDADAADVVGVPDPARLPRDLPGRAYVRLGPSEVVPVQTALATGRTGGDAAPVRVRPFLAGEHGEASTAAESTDGPSDLERMVAAARAASEAGGYPEPRSPWPAPLPEELTFEDLDAYDRAVEVAAGAYAEVALLDDPDRQRQTPVGWDLEAGNLLVIGIPGSGTTTTLASIGLRLAAHASPDDLHLYVLDAGRGELAPLADLPHVGAVVLPAEGERQRRLVRHLRREVDARRAEPSSDRPRIVLLLDGYGAFAAAYDEPADLDLLDALARIVADGPGVGVHTALTAARVGDVPGATVSTVSQRWVHRLADAYDLSAFGITPSSVPDLPPGRIVLAESGQVAHVARPADIQGEVARIAAAHSAPARGPRSIGTLPVRVGPGDVPGLDASAEVWRLPIGIADDTLEPAAVTLHPGEHLLVAGPARSGRSSVLAALARLADAAGIEVVTLVPRRSPVTDGPGRHLDATQASDLLSGVGEPRLVLIDDADLVDDADGRLAELLRQPDLPVRVVAAGRADALRQAYGHWTQGVRRSRTGLLLTPDLDLDGDLLSTRLPRRADASRLPGRGWLVADGATHLVQAVQELPQA